MREISNYIYCFTSILRWRLIAKFAFRPSPGSWSSDHPLPTNHEVPVWIPGSTVGIISEEEDSCGGHGLGRVVEYRFKGPPGTTSFSITTHVIGTT